MSEKVNFRGIVYRVSTPDARTVVFTEDQPCGNRPTRFMLHKPLHGIWYFHYGDAWGGSVACSHIRSAHEWVCGNVFGDHDEPDETKP